MGKKSSSPDLSGLYQYSDKALKLNEKQYEEGKQQMQPWYQAGTGAIGQLSNLMGIKPSAGASAYNRQAMFDQYKPQFTTTQNAGVSEFKPVNPTGGDSADNKGYQTWLAQTGQKQSKGNMSELAGSYNKALASGWGAGAPQSTNTDTAALNAYIDQQLASQDAAATNDPNFGSLTKNYTGQDIYNDPSYQFRFGQGQKALERQLAASGKYLSPNASQALQQYGQDMGSQEYQSAYNRFNNDQNNLFSRLATLSGYGQNAAGSNVAGGQNMSNQAANIYSGLANSTVAANQAAAQNRGSMFGSLMNLGGQIGGAYFSDKRLKDNIKHIGVENGHNIYEFTYKQNPEQKFIGVIAQEVAGITPSAVVQIGEYLAVDYGAIGVEFREAV